MYSHGGVQCVIVMKFVTWLSYNFAEDQHGVDYQQQVELLMSLTVDQKYHHH